MEYFGGKDKKAGLQWVLQNVMWIWN